MQDLSLHVLDIVENSIRADATKVTIEIEDNSTKNLIRLVIEDDGKGMNEEMVKQVTNPFITTRTLRRVGLGIPLLYQNCVNAGGSLKINSQEGKGTRVEAIMQCNHIDCLPLGDMASTLVVLIQGNPHMTFVYRHVYNDKSFLFETDTIKKILGDIEIQQAEVIQWLKYFIRENLSGLYRV